MFTQKFHIADRVFFLENKNDGYGGMLPNDYILKDGIVTKVKIEVKNKLVSKKKYDGKHFVGKPDVVRFSSNDNTTSERYCVNSSHEMKIAAQLFATEEEAEACFNKAKQNHPEMNLEKNIEGYQVEWE